MFEIYELWSGSFGEIFSFKKRYLELFFFIMERAQTHLSPGELIEFEFVVLLVSGREYLECLVEKENQNAVPNKDENHNQKS